MPTSTILENIVIDSPGAIEKILEAYKDFEIDNLIRKKRLYAPPHFLTDLDEIRKLVAKRYDKKI